MCEGQGHRGKRVDVRGAGGLHNIGGLMILMRGLPSVLMRREGLMKVGASALHRRQVQLPALWAAADCESACQPVFSFVLTT